jgi:hypothetical protein
MICMPHKNFKTVDAEKVRRGRNTDIFGSKKNRSGVDLTPHENAYLGLITSAQRQSSLTGNGRWLTFGPAARWL